MQSSDLRFDSLSHEPSGVDLTRFNGSLAGYCAAAGEESDLVAEAVATQLNAYIQSSRFTGTTESYLEPPRSGEYQWQREIEDEELENRLSSLLEKSRTDPSELILTQHD